MEVARWKKPFQMEWKLTAAQSRTDSISPRRDGVLDSIRLNPGLVLLMPGWLRCYLRLPVTVDKEEKRAERQAVWCTAGCSGGCIPRWRADLAESAGRSARCSGHFLEPHLYWQLLEWRRRRQVEQVVLLLSSHVNWSSVMAMWFDRRRRSLTSVIISRMYN